MIVLGVLCLFLFQTPCISSEDNETTTAAPADEERPVYNIPAIEEVFGTVKNSATIPCRVDPRHLAKPNYMSVIWKREDLFLVSVSEDNQGALKLSYVDQTIKDTKKFTVTKEYSLVVSDLVMGDSDNYTCTVILFSDTDKTDLKERYSNMTELVVQDIPSIPGRPSLSKIQSRQATVTWEHSRHDNNSPITAYVIRVQSQSSGTEEAMTYMSTSDAPSTTVTGLLPHHLYKVSIIAVNGVGRSTESQESEVFWTESEVPEASPVIVHASSKISTQINLSWKPPPEDKINGILKGYQIQYGIVNGEYKQSYTEENKDKTNLTIPNLKPFTQYFVSVRAENDVGLGPEAEVVVRTAEGKPSKPRIIHASNQKSTSLFVSWEAPKEMRGNLLQYEIQLNKHNGTVRVKIVNGTFHSTNKAYISRLEPYTQYEIKVRAVTGGGKGEFSNMYPALTDVSTPGIPEVLNVTVIGPDSVYVQWKCPKTYYRDVDAYKIMCKDTKSYFTETITYTSKYKKCFGGKDSKFEKNVTDLPSNRVYTLQVAAITKSIIDGQGQLMYQGEYSEIHTFRLRGNKIENETKPGPEVEYQSPNKTTFSNPAAIEKAEEELMSAGIVAGIVCCLLFILLAVMVFIGCRSLTCRKYYRAAYNYLAVPTNNHTPTNIVITVPEPAEEINYPLIPVADFIQHCKSLHADSDVGFSQEFADINKLSCSWNIRADTSNQHENKAKNRYINITAFDHTRVLLKPINGRMRSADYINANYVDGYKKKQAYIATQGPLPQTFPDFWRMVWEQNSVVIVMITKLVERGRQYSERIVYHFHYTEWPDHGVPDFTLPVLKFVQKSAYINPPGAGPIVVHCSAGVGRTGTYILIDSMIEQIKDKGTIDVAGFLLHIRRQRKFLVQTEEQYMLIHDALAEYILSHDTEIKHGDLSAYIEKLTKVYDGEKDAPLTSQYRLVTNFIPTETDKLCACLNINQSKNRSNELVPLNVKRVPLPTKPGVEGSDYINATYLQGYNKTDEFILTQHPLEETVEDFWRMVWDQNSSVIFLMTPADDPEYKKFWPDKDNPIAVDTGHFKLALREEEELAHYKQLEFLLESTQDDYILMTRIVMCPEWPQKDEALYKAFDMIEIVKDLHRQNDIGPVIVIDKFGGVDGGIFCALWSLHDQQTHDKVVDVYHLCKLFHLKRPGVLGTQDDYLFLYKTMDSYIQDQSERETNNLSHHLHLRTASKKNGTMTRSPTLSVKVETNV